MLKKFFSRFIRRRHYWRDLGFDELSELYTSMMFRSLAVSLAGIFVPIYLFQLGFEVWEILFFYAVFFTLQSLAAYPVARLIAKIGPKHTILTSYVFQVLSMLMLVMLKDVDLPLPLIAVVFGVSNCLFFLAFHVDFSKVKHSEHGGKEVGWMYSMERLGAVIGPILGGVLAFFVGAEYIFLAAVLLLFVGIIPLLATSEPVKLNQKLDFRSLKVKDIKTDLIACGFFGIEQGISVIIWPLFLGVYVFTDNAYVQLGSIISASVLVSLFIARAIGRTIDKHKGRQLLRLGASMNAALHMFRAFTGGYPTALGVNLANEAVTPMYRMPFIKGWYDAADDLPGHRIVYLSATEAISAGGRALFFSFACVVAYLSGDAKGVFIMFFAVGSIASLGIMLERFRALERRA